jgi:glucose/arabinose dehydrogenase
MTLTRRNFSLWTIAGAATLAVPAISRAQSSAMQLSVTQMANDLTAPWAFGFLPGGGFLVTERGGKLLKFKDGQRTDITGLPEIAVDGQGGLLDLLIPRDHAQTGQIFMTYAKPSGRRAGTAVMRATLDPSANRLRDVTTIFEIAKGSSGGRHFGSRIVEDSAGHLFVTVGDRGDRPSAQDTRLHNGSILKITKDGAPAPGNPFANVQNAQPELYSIGHRNPQGLAIDPNGQLWASEHGARGGDEVNRIAPGANYGWPVISYGRHYSGRKIGEGTARDGLEQPAHYWDPSIAPSGHMIYSGDLFPQWRGHHFIGSLKFDYISRLAGDPLSEVQQIQSNATARVRDIREAPDGSIWFLSVGNDALYRLAPA